MSLIINRTAAALAGVGSLVAALSLGTKAGLITVNLGTISQLSVTLIGFGSAGTILSLAVSRLLDNEERAPFNIGAEMVQNFAIPVLLALPQICNIWMQKEAPMLLRLATLGAVAVLAIPVSYVNFQLAAHGTYKSFMPSKEKNATYATLNGVMKVVNFVYLFAAFRRGEIKGSIASTLFITSGAAILIHLTTMISSIEKRIFKSRGQEEKS
jgi:hypothetical protein